MSNTLLRLIDIYSIINSKDEPNLLENAWNWENLTARNTIGLNNGSPHTYPLPIQWKQKGTLFQGRFRQEWSHSPRFTRSLASMTPYRSTLNRSTGIVSSNRTAMPSNLYKPINQWFRLRTTYKIPNKLIKIINKTITTTSLAWDWKWTR